MSTEFLEIQGVTKRFGGMTVLSDVTMGLRPGQIKAIIGPNGAGKTTLFNAITGFVAPSAGCVRYRGALLSGKKPHEIAALGLVRTFQTPRVFGNMTVLENVMVGRHVRTRAGIVQAALCWPTSRREESDIRRYAEEMVRFVGLSNRRDEPAENLPFGEQRLLEIGRSLASEPEVILMDEPAAGLNDQEKRDLADLIHRVRDRGVTVLLVEHNMRLVMDISDEIMVLNFGEKIAEGTPTEIQTNEGVICAYLGRTG